MSSISFLPSPSSLVAHPIEWGVSFDSRAETSPRTPFPSEHLSPTKASNGKQQQETLFSFSPSPLYSRSLSSTMRRVRHTRRDPAFQRVSHHFATLARSAELEHAILPFCVLIVHEREKKTTTAERDEVKC